MQETLLEEFRWSMALSWEVLVLRILGSIVLGGLIGTHPGFLQNATRLRTHMLVALAAASYCIITQEMVAGAYNDRVHLDPIRMVEAVTGGVAFLAGGIIVFSKGEVQDLTTGASLWLAAAVGLAIGLGLWPLALGATLIGLIVTRAALD